MLILIVHVSLAIVLFLTLETIRAVSWRPLIKFYYVDPLTCNPLESELVETQGQVVEVVTAHIALGFEDLDRKLYGKWAHITVPAAPWIRRIYYCFSRRSLNV